MPPACLPDHLPPVCACSEVLAISHYVCFTPFLWLPAGAVQLRNELTTSFGVELPPTVTFDYPTPAALAKFIAAQTAPTGAQLAPAGSGDADEGTALPEEGADSDAEAAAAANTPAPSAPAPAPAAAAAAAARPSMQDIVSEVASIVATVLGGEIGSDEPLMAAGLDSLGE